MCTQFSKLYCQIDGISMLNGIPAGLVKTAPNVFLKHLIAFVYFKSYKQVRRWFKHDQYESCLPVSWPHKKKNI